ncbi:MAG: Hydroxypyruvate reductase [Anaerolineae bacterium]|nr:Hydroxypyruvate reductase [Anaerolineae bacterium]
MKAITQNFALGDERPKILIGSRSFGQAFPEHLTQLEEAGCQVICNQVGRAYRATELLEVLPEMDAIITGTDELTADVINAAGRLKTIAKHGVGLETINLEAAQRRGIVVSATPGAIHDAVADLTLALLLALARKIIPAHLATQAGGWKPFFGIELRNKILGVVGLGRIGKAVCVRAQSFGMRLVAFDVYQDKEFAAQYGITFVSLDELLAMSDVVTLHAAAEGVDGALIGPAQFKAMKPTALLINTARGILVDEYALVAALRQEQIAGAGLDAFVEEPPAGSPLLEMENVVLTPHIGGRTMDGQRRMGEMVIENCLRVLHGQEPLHRVA